MDPKDELALLALKARLTTYTNRLQKANLAYLAMMLEMSVSELLIQMIDESFDREPYALLLDEGNKPKRLAV